MFIIRDKEGKIFKEGTLILDKDKKEKTFTWDDLPSDIKIAQIQLTFPIPIKLKARPGMKAKKFAPLLTIGRYDRYYFFNEATIKMLVVGDEPTSAGNSELVAKVVGGIDDKLGLVVENRVDRNGNCTISRFSLMSLQGRINAKTFRAEIIRSGI